MHRADPKVCVGSDENLQRIVGQRERPAAGCVSTLDCGIRMRGRQLAYISGELICAPPASKQ